MQIIADIQPINDDELLIRVSGSRSTTAESKPEGMKYGTIVIKLDGR